MPRRPVERFIHTGRFILGDAAALPVRAGVAFEVVGNRLPSGFSAWRASVAAEAARVLRPGGRARIWSEAESHIWLG